MQAPEARYSARPTRSPFRYARALWRLVRLDPTTTTDDAAVVEIGFARSRLGRRFARWHETVAILRADPRTAPALEARRAFGPISLDALDRRPTGTLGRVFAEHCRARAIDPNLLHVPPDDEVGWLLNHLYATHDVWHVVTGWGNDLPGEIGLGAFYAAQLGSPAFFGYMTGLVFLNTVYRHADLGEVYSALVAGWRMGQRCEPLFGTDWHALWELPLQEVRARFAVDRSEIVGEGILHAA